MKKRSKQLVVFLVIVIAVLVFMLLELRSCAPDSGASTPPSTAGTTHPSDTPTVPTTTTEPEPTAPTTPTEPAPTWPYNPPTEPPLVPDETSPDDFPESNGAHYFNSKSYSWFVREENERRYYIQFGANEMSPDGPYGKYLYLDPHGYTEGKELPWDHWGYYQFMFIPSAGYVTTICDVDFGDHWATDGFVTFTRATDYNLPSRFKNRENPGTVWYMSEDVTLGEGEHIYIDAYAFQANELKVAVRIYIAQMPNGAYYIDGLTSLNLLDEDTFDEEKRYSLPAGDLEKLKTQTAACFIQGGIFEWYPYEMSVNDEDIIIDYRAAGMGTYFDYFSNPETVYEFISAEEYKDVPLVAVSIRTNGADATGVRGPMTFYYKIVEDIAGNSYELIGIDYPKYYNLDRLNSAGYPGYTNKT